MTRATLRFLWSLLFWRMRFEGMSLRPFGADGCGDDVVRCDGGEGQDAKL